MNGFDPSLVIAACLFGFAGLVMFLIWRDRPKN